VSGSRGLLRGLRRRPVRTRLALVSGGLTALILIIFAIVVGRLVGDRLMADFRSEVRATATNLGLNIALQTSPRGSLVAPNLEDIAIADDAVIRIVDSVGGVRFETRDAPDLGPPGDGTIRDGPDDLLVADGRITSSAIGFGPLFVQYAASPDSVQATISRLWLFLVGGVIVGTLLAAAAGMAVASRAMAPIAGLTRTAREIATTRDPSLRIPAPEADDEVAELAVTLDQMLRELDAARGETESTIKRQREFVADASHELRTPLTSILANLELLEGSLDSGADEDQLAATHSALRSSRRMSRLVADLLILARADAGRRGKPVPCDLSLIAGEAFEEVEPVADGHRLEAEIEPDARLRGDPDELHRMVLNLLENAIRHTPEGTRVRLELRRGDGEARLEVADDGPGLPPGLEDQVFERFVRGEEPADRASKSGEGTGLGLSIVRAVAHAHGGEVEAGRSGAGGARFSVRLPLTAAGRPRPNFEEKLRHA
jgi:two-component system, OmpR family, sensor kinase